MPEYRLASRRSVCGTSRSTICGSCSTGFPLPTPAPEGQRSVNARKWCLETVKQVLHRFPEEFEEGCWEGVEQAAKTQIVERQDLSLLDSAERCGPGSLGEQPKLANHCARPGNSNCVTGPRDCLQAPAHHNDHFSRLVAEHEDILTCRIGAHLEHGGERRQVFVGNDSEHRVGLERGAATCEFLRSDTVEPHLYQTSHAL